MFAIFCQNDDYTNFYIEQILGFPNMTFSKNNFLTKKCFFLHDKEIQLKNFDRDGFGLIN